MSSVSRFTDIRWTDRYVTDFGIIEYAPHNWSQVNYIAWAMFTDRPDAIERWAQARIECGLPLDAAEPDIG